jgi:hypothetical protein
MFGISSIDFFEKGEYSLNVWINQNTESFQFHFGFFSEEAEQEGQLQETGFSFSGENGYLFDQEGLFFGGYRPEEYFNIKIIKKNYSEFSYYLGDVLISNNRELGISGISAIKFSDYNNSKLNGESFSREADNIEAGTFGYFLEDNLDNLLYSSDNILLISHL